MGFKISVVALLGSRGLFYISDVIHSVETTYFSNFDPILHSGKVKVSGFGLERGGDCHNTATVFSYFIPASP